MPVNRRALTVWLIDPLEARLATLRLHLLNQLNARQYIRNVVQTSDLSCGQESQYVHFVLVLYDMLTLKLIVRIPLLRNENLSSFVQ